MPESVPRIRREAVPDGVRLVVRGHELDFETFRADAHRFRRRYQDWGRFGVSGFLASDDDEVDALCETRLNRFPIVVLFRCRDLESAGLEVVPTFRTPRVTIAHLDLETLVRGLLACEHRALRNPHWEQD